MKILSSFRFWIVALLLVAAVSCRQAGDREIRVMTFNIRLSPSVDFDGDYCWNNRREAAVRIIGESEPDLFGIQEGYVVQVDYLEEQLPGYGRYGVSSADCLGRGEANAIFWRKDRFDLVQDGIFWLSETPDTVSLGWDGAYKRTVVWAQLRDRLRGRDVWFFNTHFDHAGVVAQVEAGKLLAARMKAMVPEGDAIFLAGDFNVNWDSPVLDPIRQMLLGCRETAPVTDDWNTYHGWGEVNIPAGEGIIDHIFFRGAEAERYELLFGDKGAPFFSDHWPVLGVLRY